MVPTTCGTMSVLSMQGGCTVMNVVSVSDIATVMSRRFIL